MTDKREDSRRATRSRRVLARLVAADEASVKLRRIEASLQRVRSLLTEGRFIDVLRSQNINTMPRTLVAAEMDEPSVDDSRGSGLSSIALTFAVTWKFFYPLMSNPTVSTLIDELRPGLIADLKDDFIRLVVEGPFIPQMSGHVGRRPAAKYHSSARRPNRQIAKQAPQGTDRSLS